MSGVMPIIFASSILSLPPTIELFMTVKEGSAGRRSSISLKRKARFMR